MAKYEANWEMLDRLKASINTAKENGQKLSGMGAIQKVRLIEGNHYYEMDIVYASLLAEHIEEQLKANNIVDVQLFSRLEWLEMEQKLQEDLERDN